MQTWEQQVLQVLEEEYQAKDLMARLDACEDSAETLHLAYLLKARRDQASWIKQKIEAIIYADEAKDTRRAKGKEVG